MNHGCKQSVLSHFRRQCAGAPPVPSLLPRYAHPLPSGLHPHPLRRLRLPGRAGGLPWPHAGLFSRPRTLPCRGCRMNAAATFPLTSSPCLGNSDLPQNVGRRSRRLCRAPHGEKSGFSCFVSNPATGASCGRCYILTGHVLMFVRLRRPCVGRGACPVFFCAHFQNNTGVPCSVSSFPAVG